MRYLLTATLGLLTLLTVVSCQKEISQEAGSPAVGSLRADATDDCLPKTVVGAYEAAKALNDSNYIEVTVDVTTAGPYRIVTDTANGYSFSATGTFAGTGPQTVRLKGSGTPVDAQTDDFTVIFDTSFCFISVDVLPAGASGGPATYTLDGSPASCATFVPFGNYIKDTTLTSANYVTVNVNVTTVGTYAISTTVVNGYSFSATGTFGATGVQTVRLNGSGKPVAAGTDAFTATAGTSTCTFPITVTATAPAGCNTNVQGTYTANTAVTAANQVSFTHTYATSNSFTVRTNTQNGLSFGPISINATAGASTNITLAATGTPTTAGTYTFTVDFGDGTPGCSFTVTVGGATPVNADYFPTTQNSWWTYDFDTDTFRVTVNGTQIYSGQTYQRFVYDEAGTPFLDEYNRKDAAGNYFRSVDTAGFGVDSIFFNQARFDVLFLKNTLATNASWNSDVAATVIGMPATIRFKYTCTDATGTATINSNTFTNVYKITMQPQLGVLGTFVDAGTPVIFYYARGIGLIFIDDGTDQQEIRRWVVN